MILDKETFSPIRAKKLNIKSKLLKNHDKINFKGFLLMKRLIIFLFFLVSGVAHAAPSCWDYAGAHFKLDPWRLMAIAGVESRFTHGALGNNTNNTSDLGLMQVNTIHLKEAARYGISKTDMQYDSCKNVVFAAYILKQCIGKYGDNVWGYGCYHSQTRSKQYNYGQKVVKEYDFLVNHFYKQGIKFNFETYKYLRNK